jgi:TonB-linked SusC/RagA family outer membrane protein
MKKCFTNCYTAISRIHDHLRKRRSFSLAIALLLSLQLVSFWSVAQEKTITGVIRDVSGLTLPGVSVKLKNTQVGASTLGDGKFLIKLPSGQTNPVLVVSYVGYDSQEVTIGSQTNITITLKETNKDLDEVVVVGYGTRKKETLTGAIATVSAKSFEDKGSLPSPLQALQGQVPGAIITRSSAAPGDEAWGVKLRGAVSVNATEPLVVIDGVAADSFRELRLINPSDIENISFLKDASAAIYGSRAAGGVMLVTTKKAKLGRTTVEYGGSYTRKIVGLQPRLMSMDEWANGVIDARTNDGFLADDVWIRYAQLALQNKGGYVDLTKSGAPISGAFTDVKDFVFLDNNWTDILWGGANSMQHDLSVSGRNEKSGYRLSLGYLDDDGTLRYGNNTNKRYNIRLNNNFNLSDKVSIESVIAYNRQAQVSPTMLGNVLGQGYPQPGLPAEGLTGKPYAWGGQFTPAAFAQYGGDNKLKVSQLSISEMLKYKITKDLSFVTNLGYNTSYAGRDTQQNPINWYNYTGTILVQSNPTQAASYFQKSGATTDFYSAAAYLQYVKTIAKDHNLDITAGAQYERNEYDYSFTKILDINPSLNVLSGAGATTTGKTKNHYALGSYYGRASYNYQSKYLFDFNGRYDGSSKFLPVNRWNFFYSFAGAWRLSQEDFLKDNSVISELKLRASYGIVGNQAGIDLYDGQQLYSLTSATGAYLGPGQVSYVSPSGTMVSYNRTWERLQKYNIGLDFGFLKNRLTGYVEIFRHNNNNMLLAQTYSGVLGANAPTSNIGKFRAQGAEGTINWSDKIGEINYRIGGVFTYATNKLIDFGGANVTNQGFNGAVQGNPLNSVFGLVYAGRIQSEAERQAYLDKFNVGNGIGLSSAIRVGDNMYFDNNGDGKLDLNDLVYLGSDDPKISYSFNLGADWKGFDFSAIFQGAGQRTIFRDDVNWRQPFRSVYLNTSNQSVDNHWTPTNTEAHFPKYSTNGTINTYNYQASSWSVENGAYLRLKNIVIGYTLPSDLIKKTKVLSRLRVYASGSDLWEHTLINDGWDPEATRAVSVSQRYPFNRTLTFGLNATF